MYPMPHDLGSDPSRDESNPNSLNESSWPFFKATGRRFAVYCSIALLVIILAASAILVG